MTSAPVPPTVHTVYTPDTEGLGVSHLEIRAGSGLSAATLTVRFTDPTHLEAVVEAIGRSLEGFLETAR